MQNVAEQVLDNTKLCDINLAPEIENCIYDSLHVMKAPKNGAEFIFNATVVDHLLTDLQCQANAIVTGEPRLWERTPELFFHGMTAFISRLDPITQAQDIAHLGYDIGHLLYKGFGLVIDAGIHPLATADNIDSSCYL